MKNNSKKQEIIDAYAKVIETCGIEGASLGNVAKEIDIPQSLIFHYFINKDDLTTQLASQFFEVCARSYRKAWPKKGEYTCETFVTFVEYILDIHHNRRKSASPDVYMALLYMMPRETRILQAFIDLNDKVISEIAEQLEHFCSAGVISIKEPTAAARTMICIADGILCHSILAGKSGRAAFMREQRNLYLRYVGFTGSVEDE